MKLLIQHIFHDRAESNESSSFNVPEGNKVKRIVGVMLGRMDGETEGVLVGLAVGSNDGM